MKNNAKTVSVILSVTMLIVTVFAFVSLTYSWFYNHDNAEVTSINMTSGSSDGILLSTNAEDWQSTLTAEGTNPDINIDETKLINSISTSGTVVDGNLQFFSGAFDENGFNTTQVTDQALFHTFDFYVLNNEENNKKLTLDYDSSVIDTNNKELSLSTRVGFINLGSVSTSTEATALDGTGVSTLDYIWEPNSTTRSERVESYHDNYINEGKAPYEGIRRQATDVNLESGLVVNPQYIMDPYVQSVQSYDPIGAADENSVAILQNLITKIRVFIWSEGQDIDCNNSISGGTASLYFNLSTYNVDESFVPVEKFNAPSITNDGTIYSWNQAHTNLSTINIADGYLFQLSSNIDGVLTKVRTIKTTNTSLNIDNIVTLQSGEYFVQVRAYKSGYCTSNFSNMLSFIK
jgi:hypothetical protein